uniref:Uncharacterized protein n=1 Tax=Tanacetum cinerariifolium TaxID=118510 RepID=A0A699I2G5_TANCI|nr:hypothetical protein [Tanacetum cinerariifolium]
MLRLDLSSKQCRRNNRSAFSSLVVSCLPFLSFLRLDKYILAYLRRRGLTESAAAFDFKAQINDEIIKIEGTKGEVLLWDVRSHTFLPKLKLPNTILNVCFQPDTTFLAASCGYKIYYYDLTKVSEAPVVLIGHAKPTERDETSILGPLSSQSTSAQQTGIYCARVTLMEAAGASHVKFRSRNMLAIAAGRRIMLLSLIHTDSGEIKETSRDMIKKSTPCAGTQILNALLLSAIEVLVFRNSQTTSGHATTSNHLMTASTVAVYSIPSISS